MFGQLRQVNPSLENWTEFWSLYDFRISKLLNLLCDFRDVSSVEVLMNYHQSLKSEVEARSRSTLECIEMGKTLLAVRNPAAEEVRDY